MKYPGLAIFILAGHHHRCPAVKKYSLIAFIDYVFRATASWSDCGKYCFSCLHCSI